MSDLDRLRLAPWAPSPPDSRDYHLEILIQQIFMGLVQWRRE